MIASVRCAKDIRTSTYADYDVAFHMELLLHPRNCLLIAVYTAIEPLMKQIVEHVVKSGGKVENDSGFHAAILGTQKLLVDPRRRTR